MSSNIFEADSTAIRLVPWRENRQPRNEAALQPRKAVFGEVPPNPAQLESSAAALERRVRESWQEGFDAGQSAAQQRLEGEFRAGLEKLASTILEVEELRSETIRRTEADLVCLSIEIARRVLHRELTVDSSALEALIKAALAKLRQQEVYRVRVCPGEEPLMRSCLEQAGRDQVIEIISDPSQSRGGAFFEISRGALDASMETQLREIERGLIGELEARLA